MAAITICSDFGAPKIKSDTVSTVSPSISHEVMGPDAMILAYFKSKGTLVTDQSQNLFKFLTSIMCLRNLIHCIGYRLILLFFLVAMSEFLLSYRL